MFASRYFFCIFSFLLITANWLLGSEKIPQFGRTSNAERISLNGQWKFRVDPQDYGLTNKWYNGDDNVEWETWQTIDVPSSFNVGFKELWTYEGAVWYKKNMTLSQKQIANGNRIVLRFLAASLRKKVWVNGTLVGENVSPYSPFEFDITEAVQSGKNIIVVYADTRRLPVAVPDRKWNGWWNYGGIYRDVFVEIRPAVSLKYLWMTTEKQNGWKFTAYAELADADQNDAKPVIFSLKDDNGQIIWQREGKARGRKVSANGLVKNVKQWEPGSPVLYTLSALAGKHRLSVRTAFRQIETRGSKILLNGNPIKLYGINYHEDHVQFGNALPVDIMKKDLDDIRELGCNFIRTSHYTSHPFVFDYCDENGILVWTEIPAWKTDPKSLSDENSWNNFIKPQLVAMVQEYRQHPSVVFWSVGNEFKSNESTVANYVKRATAFVKSMDNSRLVTFASDKRLKDKAVDYVDVISWNEYYGWYYGEISDLGKVLDDGHKLWPDKPILISEFGAGGPIDRPIGGGNANKGKHYSLEFQNHLIQTHLQQIYHPKRASFVAGATLWCFADFADPHRYGKGHPASSYQINTKGLLTRNRQRKPSFDVVKGFYHAEQNNK